MHRRAVERGADRVRQAEKVVAHQARGSFHLIPIPFQEYDRDEAEELVGFAREVIDLVGRVQE
jgi:HEPN domain-containing protein